MSSLAPRSEAARLPDEPRIGVDLVRGPPPSARVSLHMPDIASRLLVGRTPRQAVRIVPALFAICGHAHGQAAAAALAVAQGRPVPTHLHAARDLLTAAESLREGMLRACIGWSAFADEAVAAAPVRRILPLVARLRQAVFGTQHPFESGATPAHEADTVAALVDEAQSIVESAVFGEATGDWLARRSRDAIAAWASHRATLPARLADRILQQGWEDAGRAARAPLQISGLQRIEHLFAQGGEGEDALAALWPGIPDTHPLDRFRSEEVEPFECDGGCGILARLLHLLRVLASLPDAMRQTIAPALEGAGRPAPVGPAGFGLATAWSPRGVLVHVVSLRDERIERYDVIQPTRLNFAAGGIAERALTDLVEVSNADDPHLDLKARLVVAGLDPCVTAEVRVF